MGKTHRVGKGGEQLCSCFMCAGVCAPGSHSGLPSVWCPVISNASLSHSPRPSTCLCVWVSKPLCVSLCLSLFGLWVSLFSTRSQTVCLPPIRCVPRSEFPFGVWKCEYHQINESGAQCLCPLVPSAASPAACGRCLEEGESAELQKRMSWVEPEMLQEDVEGTLASRWP